MAKTLQKYILVAFLLLHYFSIVCNTYVHKNQLKIGAILENRNGIKPTSLKKAFHTAVNDINKSNEYNFKFVPILEVVNNGMYDTMVKTCSLLENNVVAIFGPLLEDNSNIVQSITDFKEIPHIEFRWDVHPLTAAHVNIHPYPAALIKTYLDIIKLWEWKDFVILYDSVESLQRIGEIVKHFNPTKHKIIVKQLKGEYRDILKELWRSKATHFVLDCTIDILPEVLAKAQQVGLMTHKEHYIITNPNLHTIDLTQYQYGETNITGIRFLNTDEVRLGRVAIQIHEMIDGQEYIAGWKLLLEEALLYDAVTTFANAVKEAPPIELPTNISCHNDNIFRYGMSIISYMKNVNYNGLSGKIKFDTSGFRTNFVLDIMELKEGGLTKIGIWNPNLSTPLVIDRVPPADDFADIQNRTFKVIITMTEPYGMKKQSLETLYGNDQYEGFAVDLINELSIMRGFNYTLVEKGSAVGKFDNATGEWDGILGDIRAGRADLAVTDLSITSERREAVDFSAPFMTLGISILYQEPQKAPPSFFSFADPFAWEVWRLLMVACVGISFILFIVGRISPKEWENPYPCIEEPEYLVNQLDLRNCSWFVTGSIMQQGSEIELKSVGSRMVAGMWWFFTLLMVSSYTANLAAFLTTETPDPHFTNLDELINNAEQKGITYGAKLDGSTANFFRDKALTSKVYEKAWQFMQENKDTVMVKETNDGVHKAATEKYAFFMESSSIAYEIQRKCNLQQVNGVLDEKGYGIAMKKNATFRNSLSTAILQLQSSGKIEEIRRKWWEQNRGGGQCGDKDGEAEAKPLFPVNVGGVFGVTLAGTGLAIVCAMMETFSNTLKKSIKTKRPLCTVLKEEVKFYFSFRKMVKPVTHGSSLKESPISSFQCEERDLGFDFVNRKQTSFDTLESYTNSNKSKKSKNKLK